MKTYNVIDKKSGALLLSFITYDKYLEKKLISQFNKIKQVNICEVKPCEKKI